MDIAFQSIFCRAAHAFCHETRHHTVTVRADILGHFPDILGQRQFQATWYHIFQVACHIRKCFKQ